ncbi:MAG: metallophosphoesterase [Oscillospiraceae bacterium]|jgi:predicted phosphohydrolase|nr:metallophosphoesterase [Oscillospiraceae bacterium]
MAVYAIGDLHLPFGSPKSMDIFGGAWEGYVDKLRVGLSILQPDDICVLAGDLSWAMRLPETLPDFQFVNSFPGRKIVLKGNHDYWWETVGKNTRFLASNGINSIEFLHNNHFEYNGIGLCGTRGWFFEEEKGSDEDRKIFARELLRLEASLKSADGLRKYVFLHYPPLYRNYECREIISLFEQYEVERCYYGHIHGAGHRSAFEGIFNGVEYTMISADWLNFNPVCVAR